MEKEYSHLDALFGAWFHQDWGVEAEDWEGVVRLFAGDNPPAVVDAAAVELRALLDKTDSDSVLAHTVFNELGCCYTPRPDLGGPSVRQWLEQVWAELAGLAARRP